MPVTEELLATIAQYEDYMLMEMLWDEECALLYFMSKNFPTLAKYMSGGIYARN